MAKVSWLKWITLVGLLITLGGCEQAPVDPMVAQSTERFTDDIVLSASLSDDGKMVALLTGDKYVRVWDKAGAKALQTWGPKKFEEEIQHIALSGDKSRLVVAGYWTVNMLDVTDGSIITVWDVQGFNEGATVAKLDIDRSGYHVLVGMSDGAVMSVNLDSGNALKLDHHQNEITNLSYSQDHQYAVSGSTDKNFAYWRTDNGEVLFQQDFRSRVTALALDSKSNQVFVSDALNSHWIMDVRNGKNRVKLDYFERFRYFRQAVFLEQGRYLATGSPKNVLTLWDAKSGKEKISWQIHRASAEASVWDMTVNSAGELVTLSSDGTVQIWNVRKYL